MALSPRRQNAVSLILAQGSPSPVAVTRQTIIEQASEIFGKQLLQAWNRQRTLPRLKKKFLETRALGSSSTSRIFLDHGGFQAWLAYFLATEGKAHFKGRHDRLSVLAAFTRLTSDAQANVARRVADVRPHHTVSSAIEKIPQIFAKQGRFELKDIVLH
ncbi:hypothetical protein NYO67_8958 [Aspergillus flavus]|nr:hypothetical protein NYO67_8958 [Aspergillus flavus]